MRRKRDYLPDSWQPIPKTLIDHDGSSFVVPPGGRWTVECFLLRWHPMQLPCGTTRRMVR